MNDDEIWICRAAILRIANMRKAEDRQRALDQYHEPLRGVIARGLAQVLPRKFERWRRETEKKSARTVKQEQ